MITSVFNDEGAPVEIGPGRGDLRRGSVPFALDLQRSVRLVERHVSYSRIFATQPVLAGPVNWLLRQSKRVPLKVYRRVEEDATMPLRPRDHPLAAAIAAPWPRGSQAQLVSFLLGSYAVHGNTVMPVDSGANNAIRFEPADWRFVIPIMPWRGEIAGWEINTDQGEEQRKTRGADTVLHIHEYSPLGPFGISPLQQLGVTIAIEDALLRHQRATLQNGVRTSAAVKTTDDKFFGLDPAERKELMSQLREDIKDIQSGPENAGRPWLLPPGLDVTPFGQTAVEAQLIEQRKVNQREALTMYGVTPATQGIIERSAELPEQRQMAISEGLAPPLMLIEACITSQIAHGLLGEDDVFVAFDFTQILRGDFLREVEALQKAVSVALMNPEEGRGRLGLPRTNLPEMEQFYMPRNNLIPVDVPYSAKGMDGGGTADEEVPAVPEGEA